MFAFGDQLSLSHADQLLKLTKSSGAVICHGPKHFKKKKIALWCFLFSWTFHWHFTICNGGKAVADFQMCLVRIAELAWEREASAGVSSHQRELDGLWQIRCGLSARTVETFCSGH